MKSLANLDLLITGLKVPVQVFSLSKSSRPTFEMADSRDMARIRCPRINSLTGLEVPKEHICKSYLFEGKRLRLPDELAAEASKKNDPSLNLESFFDYSDFPFLVAEAYYMLAPQKGWEENYMLLFKALSSLSVFASAHAVFMNSFAPLIIFPDNEMMILARLKYAADISPSPLFAKPQIQSDSAPFKALGEFISPRTGFFDYPSFTDPFRPLFEEWIATQEQLTIDN